METLVAENSQSIFPRIPEEIIVEVLSRLPLDSLSRFTCVSKRWCSLISNLSAKQTGRRMVLVMSSEDSIRSVDEEGHVERVRRPWKKNKKNKYMYRLRILGSCNGLLLIHINEDLFLWNPLTRYFRKAMSYDRLKDHDDYHVVGSGFCYDSSADKYKAVLALCHNSPGYGGKFVEVGSLRSKTWRFVRFSYNVGTICPGPIVNGHLHWSVARKNSNEHFFPPREIIYFDSSMGKFKKVPMPPPKHEDVRGHQLRHGSFGWLPLYVSLGDKVLGLGVLDGCLCMSRLETPNNSDGNVEVLAMKEYGMEQSWIVLFIISDLALGSLDELVPLSYTKNGETLVKTRKWVDDSDSMQLRAYNSKDNSCRKVAIQANDYYVDEVAYEERLVTPIGYNWEEQEMRGEATYVEYYLYGSLEKRRKVMDGSWEVKEEFQPSSDESDFGD